MLKHGIANTVGNALRIGLAIISIPILVKNLGLRDYGFLVLLQAIMNLGSLSEAGLSTSTTIHTAAALGKKDEKKLQEIIGFTFALAIAASSLAALLIICLAPFLAKWLFVSASNPSFHTAVIALTFVSLAIVARTIFQVMIGLLHAKQKFALTSSLQTTWFYLMQLSLIGIASFSNDLAHMGAAIAGAALVSMMIAWWKTRQQYDLPMPKWKVDPETKHTIINSTCDIGLTNLANTMFVQGDKVVVGAILSPTLVGIYSTFTAIASQINILSAAVCQPVIVQIAGLDHQSATQVRPAFISAFSLCALTASILACSLILLMDPIIGLMFPSIPVEAYPGLLLLIGSYTLFSFNAPAYFTLQAMHRTRFVRNVTLLAGAGSLIAIAALTYTFGLNGAACGTFVFASTGVLTGRVVSGLKISVYEVAPSLIGIASIAFSVYIYTAKFSDTVCIVALCALCLGMSSFVLRRYRKHRLNFFR